MKKTAQYIMFSAFLLLLWSFQLPKEYDQSKIPLKVKKKLDQEVTEYYYERRKSCELDALVRAEDFVDSIIVNKINIDILRGISFPKKPTRPKSPHEILLDDTTVIKPILKG